MSTSQHTFVEALNDLLEETFEDRHHGIYLDKGTSLFETLGQISAQSASIPVGKRCATIAAQVEHVIFYLEVLEKALLGQELGKLDWDEIWNRVSSVTAEEWDDIRLRLRQVYVRLKPMLQDVDYEAEHDAVWNAMAIVVHTAYHLGEIRQALCTVAPS